MFEQGKYKSGDPFSYREKEGFANVGASIDILGFQLPRIVQSGREVNLTDMQSFLNELFPKDLASR